MPTMIPTNQQASLERPSAKRTLSTTVPQCNLRGSGPPQILLVEDEFFIREFLSLAFRAKGIEVTEAENGLEALALFKSESNQFDLIITDLQMPGMDGKELIANLKRKPSHPPIILCSAVSLEKVREIQADAFFKKPYNLNDLQQMVLHLLKKEKTQA